MLEVLRILEAEINLREETRVAEQAKAGVDEATHHDEATRLAGDQNALRDRTDKVIARIEDLPDGGEHFGKEIALLTKVSTVMSEARGLLAGFDTGSRSIAAETEVIELLLASKRINPQGGGGGGSSPGGGGAGDTQDTALALLGRGVNEKEHRVDKNIAQSTGETGARVPDEFRAGLDEYFHQWEQ